MNDYTYILLCIAIICGFILFFIIGYVVGAGAMFKYVVDATTEMERQEKIEMLSGRKGEKYE